MKTEDFKWKLGRIFYDLAEGKIGVLDAYERFDAIENEKVVLPQADVIKSVCPLCDGKGRRVFPNCTPPIDEICPVCKGQTVL